MKISSYNINGIKARIETVLAFCKESAPDVAILQEIKTVDENFPRELFEDIGYNVVTHGQKSFNGVAVLSKLPIDEVRIGLPGDESDEQARYVEVEVDGITICGLYLPNGNPVDTEKFPYKLAWMDRLIARAEVLLAQETPFVMTGDFNIIPTPEDCFDAKAWEGDALYHPESLARFRKLINMGLRDAFRLIDPSPMRYTFWDFQAGAWNKNNGIRIDHFMLSPELTDRLETVEIERHWRGREKPSDHVPITMTLRDISDSLFE